MIPLTIAGLVFLLVATLVIGLWWASEARRRVKSRLEVVPLGGDVDLGIVRTDRTAPRSRWLAGASRTDAYGWLSKMLEQAGFRQNTSDVVLLIGAAAVVCGAAGWLRTGGPMGGLLAAGLGASLPVVFILHRRRKRLQRFEQEFPDALDAMARAIRAGNALSAAIQLVGDEAPEPIGPEFQRVTEEIRLGLEPSEALFRLGERVPTEDMGFFCAAIRIQRGAGGNLAELLDRLAEIIRERYRILSHARVLSAQHKWSAICVGLAPLVFSILLELFNPGYFEPLLSSPTGPLFLAVGLVWEAIGFFMIYRIAQIKV